MRVWVNRKAPAETPWIALSISLLDVIRITYMSTQLIPFSFESHSIRVIQIDGDPWFVGKDVAEVLGYKDPTTAIKSHCRGVQKLHPITDSLGRTQEARILNEPDVFRLIVSSTLPEAQRFEAWLFEEVLPAIRKTGRYEAKPVAPHADTRVALDLFSTSAKAAKAAGFKGNMIALSAGNLTRSVTGIDVLALMGATHLLANPRGLTYTPTELGKLCDPPLGPVTVNLKLEAAGLQSREFDHWLPADAANGLFEWLDTGKRHSNGAPVKQVKWFRGVLEKVA